MRTAEPSTIVDLLRSSAARHPDQRAFTFLVDGETAESSLTFGELDRKARTVAAFLQSQLTAGDRALLLYPPGLDYLVAFFGCLYAGVIAVPTYPPGRSRRNRALLRLEAIAADAQARAVLTTTAIVSTTPSLFDRAPRLRALQWIDTDRVEDAVEDAWREPALVDDTLAFLQYTSGSTGSPKGVMLSHANLLHNQRMIKAGMQHTEWTIFAGWLPLYHDMGLIGNVLQPLYLGVPCILMSPLHFLQRPVRWLQAISRYRATTSGAPDFAYELCVRQIDQQQRASLDLSSWSVAFNGAQPVRAATIDRFAAAFASCGFRREAFYPCYGLAEATLIVSGGFQTARPLLQTFDAEALERNRAIPVSGAGQTGRTLVGCGRSLIDQTIAIVDPQTSTQCPPGQIGEIWVSGASVARGYWNRASDTDHTFQARLSDTRAGGFLRTGDLGVFSEGELFVAGRLTDLIIVRGLNYYPQDIEVTVQESHPSLPPDSGAAVSVDVAGEERLVVVQEVRDDRHLEKHAIVRAIRQAVSEEHEVDVYAVVLVKSHTIPKTSNGKIQRRACRAAFLAGTLEVVESSIVDDARAASKADAWVREGLLSTEAGQRHAMLEAYLQQQIARMLQLVFPLPAHEPLTAAGLDSLRAVEFQHHLEDIFGVILPSVDLLQGLSISQVATHVLTQLAAALPSSSIRASGHEPGTSHPLSHAQRALWYSSRFAPDSSTYNIARAVRIHGDLDVAALKNAFQTLLDRHGALRTTFSTVRGEPVQRVHEKADGWFRQLDAAAWTEASLKERLNEAAYQPFDLERGPLLRVHLFVRSAEECILLLVVHHIAADFWSLAVLLHEFRELFAADVSGTAATLEPPRLQYTDYATWQSEILSGPEGERLWAFWQKHLSGELPVLNLPVDQSRPRLQTRRGGSRLLMLDAQLTEKIAALSQVHGVTLYVTLLAAFNVLLHRYTGSEQLLVGSPTTGRNRAQLAGVIGHFVNPVVLRGDLSGDPTFVALLTRLHDTVRAATAHQDYPFGVLVERLQPERHAHRSVLFQVVFAFQKAHLLDAEGLTPFALPVAGGRMTLGPLTLESIALDEPAAQFDLTMTMAEIDDGLAALLAYDADLFTPATITRMLEHFRMLLESIAADPRQRISELSMLTECERHLLLVEWNHTRQADVAAQCIDERFEMQVERMRDAVAVALDEEQWTYGQLNTRATRLANYLVELGIGPEVRVGICLERGFDAVVGIVGILKAGAAYLPLDPTWPAERLALLLADAGVQALVTRSGLAASFADVGVRIVCVDRDAQQIAHASPHRAVNRTSPPSAAYVIYTSGSTGVPKGVVVSHANLLALLNAADKSVPFGPGEIWTWFHSIGFDFSVWEIWGALLHGARLVVVPYEVSRQPAAFADLLRRQCVTVLNLTPSAFRELSVSMAADAAGRPAALKRVIFGGEALEPASVRPWLDRGEEARVELINMYGITETTVHVTYHRLGAADLGPGAGSLIGRPLPGLQIYILDAHDQPVPIGIAGELYVGGRGLARSYLNRPDLTADRFIPDPFSSEPGARLYRSGDVGRRLPGGDIEYRGRIDQQVKVRGFRVEPAEIESALCEHPAVRQAVVVVHGDRSAEGQSAEPILDEKPAGEIGELRRFLKTDLPASAPAPICKTLTAYIVCDRQPLPTVSALHRFVKAKLPDYMVPAAFVFLHHFPLTPNGKLNRSALPAPGHARPALEEAYVPPRTSVERELADIWGKVLAVDRVGIDDNYFALGGDSIRTLRVQSLAAERQLPLAAQDLFRHQTIRELAASLGDHAGEWVHSSHSRPFSLISEDDQRRLPDAVEDAYPLSRLQAGLIFHSQHHSESPMYRDIFIYRVRMPFEPAPFRSALQDVVDRHPVLRTAYELTRFSEPHQLVYKSVIAPLEIVDLRSMSALPQQEVFDSRLAAEKTRRLDWSTPPLIRFTVHRLTDDRFDLILTFHSSILDGWSVASMLTELLRRCDARRRGKVRALDPQPFSAYRDFVALERAALASAECRDYWARYLSECSRLVLPRLAPPAGPSHRIAVANVPISSTLSEDLKSLARDVGVPLKHVLLAAHLWVMSRLSGQRDVLTGLESNGRLEEPDGDVTLGVYLNMLPFRQTLGGGRWIELIRQTFANDRELFGYRRFPYAELQQMHDSQPLFETAFNYTHFHVFHELARLDGVNILDSVGREQTHYTMKAEFNRDPFSDRLHLDLEVDANQICEAQIRAIAGYYTSALTAMTRQPDARYESASLLTAAEQHARVVEWNDTAAARLPGRTIHGLFEAQAKRTPDSVAVISPQGVLTYGELNARANRLARHLQGRGVGPEDRVAIYLQRSTDTIATLLGVLKAGAAFVPLDPASPRERLALMLANCQPTVLVTAETLFPTLPRDSCAMLLLDRDRERIAGEDSHNLDVEVSEDGLAYVIYTSGSTGHPKGVAAPHRGTLNRFQWMWDNFPYEPGEVCCQKTQLGFVGCIWELFGPLLQGLPVVMIPHDTVKDTKAFLATLAADRVTRIVLVPSLLGVLLDLEPDLAHRLPHLKYWVSSGEELSHELSRRFRERMAGRILINIYGSTENAADVTWHHVRNGAGTPTVTIGRPIDNTAAHVLDPHFLPVPLGVPGQLYIGGISLARGYLDHPAATADRFVPDPFGRLAGGRLYQTGDVARHLPDGTLEYLGRLDQQVKVRGMRIELEEIEAVLCQHPAVREAVVVAREDVPGDKRLVAYVVAHQQHAGAIDGLNAFLKRHLPDYMAPVITVIDSLPRTPNWKVNRRALPPPDYTRPRSLRVFVAPRTETEQLVAGIWSSLLKVDRVGINDNFFELGGNSLLATQIVFRVCEQFKIELHLRKLFESPTVAGLAETIETTRRSSHGLRRPPIVPVSRDEQLPLSFAQQRLWFLDQLRPGQLVYACPALVDFTGPLDRAALAHALSEILRRHETLRTTFAIVDDRPLQVIRPALPLIVPTVDLTGLPASEREMEVRRLATEEVARPFDLTHDLLLRATLLKLSSDQHVAIFVTHHIAFDGWSMAVFMRELATLYEAYSSGQPSPLPELRIQYADYAVWQHQCLSADVTDFLLSYWQRQLFGIRVLGLPADRERPHVQSFNGDVQPFALPVSLSRSLTALSGREGATLFMTLLAAFDVVLHCQSQQTDIAVGSDVANRHSGETDGLIGFFANQVVIRADLSGNPTFRELLMRVRETALDAYAHQDLPFDKLVEALNPARDISRTPLFQVKLVLQNAPMPVWDFSGLTVKLRDFHNRTAKFDVLLNLWERDDGLVGALEYNTDVFESRTIERLLTHFALVLNNVAEQPDTRLDRLRELLDEADRKEQIADRRKRDQPDVDRLKTRKPKAVTLSKTSTWSSEHAARADAEP